MQKPLIRIILFIQVLLLFIPAGAQNLIGKQEKSSVRVKLYASLLAGSSGGSAIRGGSGILEMYNYHFYNTLQVMQLKSGINDYVMNTAKNEFTWYATKRFKLNLINSIATPPLNSYSYIILPSGNRPQNNSENFTRVQVRTKDRYIQTGLSALINFKEISLGGLYLYMDRQTFRSMSSQQFALVAESNNKRRLCLKASYGGIKNSFFKENMRYFETELKLTAHRNLKFAANLITGNTRLLYSSLDGGFTLYSEDMLKTAIGFKTEVNFSSNFGAFAKAEKYTFKHTNVNFFYFGLTYKIKPY